MMKIILILSLSLFSNILYSQEYLNIDEYSKDTITLVTGLFFIGEENVDYKYEFLSPAYKISERKMDSAYIFSEGSLNMQIAGGFDGYYISYFLSDKEISELENCNWIEFECIKSKTRKKILLVLNLHHIENYKEIGNSTYIFKVKNNNCCEFIGNLGIKYKLKRKKH